MIKVTEIAAKELRRIAEESNLSLTIRVGVKGGGCSGFSYILGFEDDEPSDVDQISEEHGIRVLCDPKSFLYLNGVQIDFEESLMGRGFRFINPNASNTCGCGESFSV